MSAPPVMPQTPQSGVINQLAAIPPLTPPDTDQRSPSVVDTTSSTTAFQENAQIYQILNKRYQDLQSKEHTISNLQVELQEQDPTIRRLKNLNAELEERNGILVKQENEASEKVKGSQAAHTEAAKQCRELTDSLADERLKVSATESSLSRLHKENEDLKATISSIKEEAAQKAGAARKEKASLTAELEATRTSLTGARQEAQESNDRANFLSNGMSDAEESLKETEKKLDAAEKKAASWKASSETATALAASEKERADKAEAELERMRRDLDEENDAFEELLKKRIRKRPLTPSVEDTEGPEGKRRRLSEPDT
ncbi:hypothetical protein PRZ48_004226 [Zasmidium cellare]|uniref:Uncharacterized protein n=1 Tax=Zasmidium cellare TaxID=395010 RepID=A0ABR0EYM3_ZASCE|nr:hypothetical protein PRZ48_004226 [Zasmidium cellare]